MTSQEQVRVTQALVAIEAALIEQAGVWVKEGGCFKDAINFALDLTVSVQDALELARHRQAAEAEAKAREAELRHIAADLLQHIDWLTSGLPALLESGGLTDEEGLIGAAVDAANSARAALTKEPDA